VTAKAKATRKTNTPEVTLTVGTIVDIDTIKT
jgi:hypothetical protein